MLLISMQRADKKNALTPDMYEAMTRAVLDAQTDKDIRVIVITGKDDVFTAGNDVSAFINAAESGRARDATAPASDFLDALIAAEKPVIAGVNGLAVGVGLTLLLHCDIVYAAESATFKAPFTDLALVPEAASTWLLPRLTGRSNTSEILLFGDAFSAKDAKEYGIVSCIYPDETFLDDVMSRAGKLARKAPGAIQATKKLIKDGLKEQIQKQMKDEGRELSKQFTSPESKEAFNAFFERRRPGYSKLD